MLRGGLAAIHQPIDWAALLKRVYQIDVLRCPCGGTLRMVALVTELKPVRNILVAMGLDPTPPARAPPRQETSPGTIRREPRAAAPGAPVCSRYHAFTVETTQTRLARASSARVASRCAGQIGRTS